MNSEDPVHYKVFIAGYSATNITVEDLQKALSRFRDISSVDIPTKTWKGYAFVNFSAEQSKDKLLATKFIEVNGSKLQAKEHKKGKKLTEAVEKNGQRRIFVKQIPGNWDSEFLKKNFLNFGKIEHAYLSVKKKNSEHHSGHLIFTELEAANKLIQMGKVEIQGSELLIEKFKSKKEKNKDKVDEEEQPENKKSQKQSEGKRQTNQKEKHREQAKKAKTPTGYVKKKKKTKKPNITKSEKNRFLKNHSKFNNFSPNVYKSQGPGADLPFFFLPQIFFSHDPFILQKVQQPEFHFTKPTQKRYHQSHEQIFIFRDLNPNNLQLKLKSLSPFRQF
jgi:hypothetical protein